MSAERQLLLPFGERSSLAGEDFLVADGNREAWDWIGRWPRWPGPALVLHGPSGCGKTHLLHHYLRRSKGRLLGPDDLHEDGAILDHAAAAFAVDDVETLLSPARERPLLHLYNIAAASGRTLLLTAASAPGRWPIGLADLRSRVIAALAVPIAPPGDDLLAALLIKLFADRQVSVDPSVVAYLVPRMERSFAAARAVVAGMDRASLRDGRPVTVALARAVLGALPSDRPAP